MKRIPKSVRREIEIEADKMQRKLEDDQWTRVVDSWDTGEFSFAPPFADMAGLGSSSRVLTPRGFESLRNLRVGDEVVSHNLVQKNLKPPIL